MRLLVALLLVAMVAGCAAGNYQHIDSAHITPVTSLPMIWTPTAKHFDANLVFDRDEATGGYVISGSVFQTGEMPTKQYTDMTFVFYCLKGNTVVHVEHMRATPYQDGHVELHKEFYTNEEFDGIAYRYAVKYFR